MTKLGPDIFIPSVTHYHTKLKIVNIKTNSTENLTILHTEKKPNENIMVRMTFRETMTLFRFVIFSRTRSYIIPPNVLHIIRHPILSGDPFCSLYIHVWNTRMHDLIRPVVFQRLTKIVNELVRFVTGPPIRLQEWNRPIRSRWHVVGRSPGPSHAVKPSPTK